MKAVVGGLGGLFMVALVPIVVIVVMIVPTAGSQGGVMDGGDYPANPEVMNEDNLKQRTIMGGREIMHLFPEIKTIYGWNPPRGGACHHPAGEAIDIMIPNSTTPEGVALGTRIAWHLMNNADRMRVGYIEFRGRLWYWGSYGNHEQPKDPATWRDRGGGWGPVPIGSGYWTRNHMDHLHVRFDPAPEAEACGGTDMRFDTPTPPLGSSGAGGGGIQVRGEWTWPFECVDLGANNFGEDRSSHTHAGEDMRGCSGNRMYAIGAGRVIDASNHVTGYGLQVQIRHPSGYTSQYGHMAFYVVHTGQQVRAGQYIGMMGNTGSSQGAHLHLNIARPGQDPNGYEGNLDPTAFLTANAGPPPKG